MKRGFTLVELIVVVIIVGILAAIGIPQYRRALERSRGAEAYAGLGHIQEAEKIYFADNEAYLPTAATAGAGQMTAGEMTSLDIVLPQTGWDFTIVAPGGTPPTFTATATRTGTGPCTGEIITIDQAGTMTDDWKNNCVDTL